MSAIDDEARRAYLISIRKVLALPQVLMGGCLGMSLRAYNDLETGTARVRLIHILAAERVLLREAAQSQNPELLTKPLRDDVKALTAEALD